MPAVVELPEKQTGAAVRIAAEVLRRLFHVFKLQKLGKISPFALAVAEGEMLCKVKIKPFVAKLAELIDSNGKVRIRLHSELAAKARKTFLVV